MFAFIIRKLIYNIPVYLATVMIMMLLLRVQDPVAGRLSKNSTQEEYDATKKELPQATKQVQIVSSCHYQFRYHQQFGS